MIDEKILKAVEWLVDMITVQWSSLDARVERDSEKVKEEEEREKEERKERVEIMRKMGWVIINVISC